MTFEESLPDGKKSCGKVQKSKGRPRGISIPKADFVWFWYFFEFGTANCPLEMKDLIALDISPSSFSFHFIDLSNKLPQPPESISSSGESMCKGLI